jgi:hypothetical protein
MHGLLPFPDAGAQAGFETAGPPAKMESRIYVCGTIFDACLNPQVSAGMHELRNR